MRRKVGDAVSDRGQRCDDKIIQFYRRGISRHNSCPKRIDDTLNHNISKRDEALLQDARNGNGRNPAQKTPGKQRRFSLNPYRQKRSIDKNQRQNTAHALAEKGRPRDAVHPVREHMGKGRREQNVHTDVCKRRTHQKKKRRSGIPQRGKDPGRHVIIEHERQAQNINIQVKLRRFKDFLRRVNQPQKLCAKRQAARHQEQTEYAAGNERRTDRGFHIPKPLGPKQLRHGNGTADVTAKRKRNKDQRDLVTVPNRGKRLLTHELSRHKAVRNVIKLLKNNASEQWNAKFPQHSIRIANGQISVHFFPLFPDRIISVRIPFFLVLDAHCVPYYNAKADISKIYC